MSRTRRRQYVITEEQVKLLNEIGFSWKTIRKHPVVTWKAMFERLVEYKNIYGHTRVPLRWNKDKKLGKWVSRMRSDREKLLPERKVLLGQIDFDWQKRPGRSKKSELQEIDVPELRG